MQSADFFQKLDKMWELFERFGNVEPFLRPLILPVRKYAVGKLADLLLEKAECSIEDYRERRAQDRAAAREIISSETFGEHNLERYAKTCLLLKSYQQAQQQNPHWPRIAEGIGMDFTSNIAKFNGILEQLLELSRPARNRLMGGIRLTSKFIDAYIGQFVYFQFQIHAPKLPRPPYGAVRP